MYENSSFKHLVIRIIIPIFFLLAIAQYALCYPCSEEPANGGTTDEVAVKCGEPMSRENRTLKVEETDGQGKVSTTTKNVTEWIYGSGADNLIQLFRFENGHLVQIKYVGYRNMNDFMNDVCRNGQSLAIGDTMAETFVKCGQPLAQEDRGTSIVETELPGKTRRTFVPVAEWTYRYGPDAPGYTVTFEDGVAVKIRTREFGK